MSKTKRRKHPGAFKAKVGLEAILGVKTVGQIAVGVGGPKYQATRPTVIFYLRLGSRGGLDLKWAASTRSNLLLKVRSISASGFSRKRTAMVIGSVRYSVCPA